MKQNKLDKLILQELDAKRRYATIVDEDDFHKHLDAVMTKLPGYDIIQLAVVKNIVTHVCSTWNKQSNGLKLDASKIYKKLVSNKSLNNLNPAFGKFMDQSFDYSDLQEAITDSYNIKFEKN